MSSRFSAARPKRAGEAFARQHHGEPGSDEEPGGSASASKKVKFDVRNPSALAPDAREEDEMLEADVIGVATATTKRGAVNIDGYDSDSDNETFNARAEQRGAAKKSKKGKAGSADVDLIDELDNYDKRLKGEAEEDDEDDGDGKDDKDEDEDDDMFGGDDDDEGGDNDNNDNNDGDNKNGGGDDDDKSRRKRKEVRFLDDSKIVGQEDTSKSGGTIRLDDASSSDEEDVEQEILEEGVDEEVGPGGLKKHAPKIDAFNMRQEQEEGAFDEAGNYIRKAMDPDAVHDRWLEGVSKRQMKRAAEAHQKRAEEVRQQRRAADNIVTADLFAALILRLQLGESPLEALARLGRGATSKAGTAGKAKRIPQWKLKKQQQKEREKEKGKAQQNGSGHDTGASHDQMVVDREKAADDPKQAKRKADIDAITDAADKLLNRDYPDIYETERERLVREYRAETGEAWVEPPRPAEEEDTQIPASWEYRWTDGRDGGKIQGPFDGATMKAWQDAGYFKGSIEFRPAGSGDEWSHVVEFV